MSRTGVLLLPEFDSPDAAAELGAGADALRYGHLDLLAEDLLAGRLDGAVVPYESPRLGRWEPVLDLLTRRRGVKLRATAVGAGPGGAPVMLARLGTAPAGATGRDRTVLLARLFDQQGILYRVLRILGEHDINIAHLHNRPDGRNGQFFCFDLECHCTDARFLAALQAVRARVDPQAEFDVLGACPMRGFGEPRLRSALIIGGTHGIGPLIASAFLEREGVRVTVAGRRTQPPYAEIAAGFDAVLFAVPLDRTVGVIRATAPRCRPGALLVNLAGRQEAGTAALLETAPAGAEVLGVHTVFGPGVRSVMGKNVVTCRTGRSGPLAEEMVGLFRKRGVVLTEAAAGEHDRLMHAVQTQWHRLLLAGVTAASRAGHGPGAWLSSGRPADEWTLLLQFGLRLLDNGDDLLWGLQTVDGPAAEAAAGAARGRIRHAASPPRPAVSADDERRAAELTDGALFRLGRATSRGATGLTGAAAGAGGGAVPDGVARGWGAAARRLLAEELGRLADEGHPLARLRDFSSPHFLAGMLAALAVPGAPVAGDGTDGEAGGGEGRAALSAWVAAWERIRGWAVAGDRAGFEAALRAAREWAGAEVIAAAVERTSRLFEQVLVEQWSALPRFA